MLNSEEKTNLHFMQIYSYKMHFVYIAKLKFSESILQIKLMRLLPNVPQHICSSA